MNGFIRTASYSRVSSQRQADEKTIDSQLVDLRQRIERDGFTIDSSFEYRDEGFTGSVMLRPALERLRDHVVASMIDRLYVHSPDRLARKFAHQAILLDEMSRHGTEVIFLNQDGLPDSPEANMLVQVQATFAEYEREKILERTRRGLRHSASKGNVSVFGCAPYGYRYFRKKANEEAHWEIEPIEAMVVRSIFSLGGEYGYSLGAICQELHARGIRTRRGNAMWDMATVRGILTNPAYFGEARYGKKRLSPRKPGRRVKRGDPEVPRQTKVAVATPLGEQIMIPVPALIEKSLFEEVSKRMQENRKRQRTRKDGAKYVLSGLLICGECGSAYCSRSRQGKSKLVYYRCIGTDKHRRRDKPICNNKSVKGEPLELYVWSDLCDLLSDPIRVEAELKRRLKESLPTENKLATQKTRVNTLRGRLDRLIDAYANGLIQTSEFENRIGPLRSQHDREVATLASQQGELAMGHDIASVTETLSKLAGQVDEKLDAASFELKRELLTLLVKRIEIHRNEIRIVYKVPPNPFVPSPGNRGKLQHCLSSHG